MSIKNSCGTLPVLAEGSEIAALLAVPIGKVPRMRMQAGRKGFIYSVAYFLTLLSRLCRDISPEGETREE